MTAQIPETLFYRGKKHEMCTEPLFDYLELTGKCLPAPAGGWCSALWRGYTGEWRVVRKHLFLTALRGLHGQDGDDPHGLRALFPDAEGRVFAAWFTGEVRLPQGKLLDYLHMGYGSLYERDLFLRFERGVLVGEREVLNSTTTLCEA